MECSICVMNYDVCEYRPVIGVCGHTVCKTCRSYLRSGGFRCPTCRKIRSFVVETPNYQLLECLEQMAKMDKKHAEMEKEHAEMEKEHAEMYKELAAQLDGCLEQMSNVFKEHDKEVSELEAKIDRQTRLIHSLIEGRPRVNTAIVDDVGAQVGVRECD